MSAVVATEEGEQEGQFPQGDEFLFHQQAAEFFLLTLLLHKKHLQLLGTEQAKGNGHLAKGTARSFGSKNT